MAVLFCLAACPPPLRVIASDSVAIFDRKIGDKHVEDCHVATLLAMTASKGTTNFFQINSTIPLYYVYIWGIIMQQIEFTYHNNLITCCMLADTSWL